MAEAPGYRNSTMNTATTAPAALSRRLRSSTRCEMKLSCCWSGLSLEASWLTLRYR
ncbi:Uncharacterised protein [Bordetella pertussis]|nr:Uncharacterised protein [Bordetella pertussis]